MVLTITLASGQVLSNGPTALATAGFVLVALWCLLHRRADQTLLALALYLGLLDGYVKLRTGSPTITLARDALVIAIAAGALIRFAQTRQAFFLPPLGGFVLAFCGVVLIELANPSGRGLVAGLAGVRQHLEFVPLFFLAFAFVRTESQTRKALLVLAICAAIGGIVSYIQSRLTPLQLAEWGPGYREFILGTGSVSDRVGYEGGDRLVRPFGLGSDVGGGAAIAAVALPGLIALAMSPATKHRWVLTPLFVGVGLAVATSGSRASIIVTFVTLVSFGLLAAASKNALKAVAGLAIGVLLLYLAFTQLGPTYGTVKRAESITTPGKALATFSDERGSSVKQFGPLVTQYPLGVGVGTVGPASRVNATPGRFNAETQWNFLLIETGIAGVAIYIALLLQIMWLAITRLRRLSDPTTRLYLAALAAPIFGMAVAGFSSATTASVPYAPYLWFASGVLAFHLVRIYGQHRQTW